MIVVSSPILPSSHPFRPPLRPPPPSFPRSFSPTSTLPLRSSTFPPYQSTRIRLESMIRYEDAPTNGNTDAVEDAEEDETTVTTENVGR